MADENEPDGPEKAVPPDGGEPLPPTAEDRAPEPSPQERPEAVEPASSPSDEELFFEPAGEVFEPLPQEEDLVGASLVGEPPAEPPAEALTTQAAEPPPEPVAESLVVQSGEAPPRSEQALVESPAAEPLTDLSAEPLVIEDAEPRPEDAAAAFTSEAADAPPIPTLIAADHAEPAPSEESILTDPLPEPSPSTAFPETPLEDRHDEPHATNAQAAPEPSAPASQITAEPDRPPPPAELPPNFFRAAGDPEELPPEPPPTLLQRVLVDIRDASTRLHAFVEPRWVAFAGAARAFGAESWRRLRRMRPPRNLREVAIWSGWGVAGLTAVALGFYVFLTAGMPSTDDLWEAQQGQSITFVDRNGHVILREGAQNAPPVELDSLPPYVAQAFLAIEDRRFYNHMGVDLGGMMRAGAENIRAGQVVQGGSTITQQLAKNLFLTNERSWRRKAQEIVLAFWLEGQFSKDEILALYLSRVYFGAGAYGIEAAAERYFDRPARELTLLQSAMLAGLVKAPSRLNPARQDIDAARDRAAVVLNEMVSLGFISATERDAALQEELVISRRNPAGVLSYYRDWIDPLLNDVIGFERDDFIVETTIDIMAQRASAEAVEAVLAEQGEARRVSQAAAVAVDSEGGVRVMVGGRDYDVSQFNRATQARRQPGSAFKYFIYLAAMENGLTPWTVREDAPITISIPGQPDWSPGNYTGEYHGAVTLTGAFANSFNMVAIRVSHEVGGDRVIDVARRLGITAPLFNYHSLALGAQEMTLLEMVGAYGAMAADGNRVEPHGVTRIRRAGSGETMWSWRPQHRGLVIEERPRRYMNEMMRAVVERGTGTRARMADREIGGKTGTGNDYRDAWFIGFTPGMVGGVWVGNDDFTTTARVTGGSLPADIWARFMPVTLRNTPVRALDMPREEDYEVGPLAPELSAISSLGGAPIGAAPSVVEVPPDNEDRSLDFGPEG